MAYDGIKLYLSELGCEMDQDFQIYYNGTNVGFIGRVGDGIINVVYESEDFDSLGDLENIYCFAEELSAQSEIPYVEVMPKTKDTESDKMYSKKYLTDNIHTLESLLKKIDRLPEIETKPKNRRSRV